MNRHLTAAVFGAASLAWVEPLSAKEVIKCGAFVLSEIEIKNGPGDVEDGTVPERSIPDRTPAVLKPRSQPLLVLKDGTRVAGKTDLAHYPLKTPYGLLTIPAAEVLDIRFGKVSDPDFKKRVDGLIRDLGAADVALREKAARELASLGFWVAPELAAAATNDDPEIRARAADLAEALEEQGESPEYVGDLDEIETKHFTARGELQVKSFAVQTPYGNLSVPAKDLRRLFVNSPEEIAKIVTVTGQHTPASWCDTGMRVSRGDRLSIRASGSVFLQNWGQAVTPQGNPQWGQQIPGINTGALVGRIGRNGSPFLVGTSYEEAVDREGTLFLGVGIQGVCPSTGEFKVDIRITPR